MSVGRRSGWMRVLLVLLALLLLHLSGIDLREETLAREDGGADAVVVPPDATPE